MGDLKEQKANLQSNLEQQLKESEHLKVCHWATEGWIIPVTPSRRTAPHVQHPVLMPPCCFQEMLTQMSKQMETREQNAAEQKKSSDEESRQREVRSVRLAMNSSDEIVRHWLRFSQVHLQEKYERAVMKINQLKEERATLRARAEAQSGEIST